MRKFFVLGVLMLSLATVFGSVACKHEQEQRSVEFSSEFQVKALSKIKEIKDKEAAHQAWIAKQKQEREELLDAAIEKVEFLEQCRNSEHLRTLLSLGCPDIEIIRAQSTRDDYFFAIVLSKSGVEVGFYDTYGWPNKTLSVCSQRSSKNLVSTERDSLRRYIFPGFDDWGAKSLYEKLAKLSNDDIKNIIEKEVMAWNGDK